MGKVGLTLSDYWLIIRKRKWIAIICFLGIISSVVYHVEKQPPVYRAVCSIRLVERKSVSDMITQMVSYTSYDLMSSLTQVLAGRPIIEKVVHELGLVNKDTSAKKLNETILGVQGRVKAEHELGTNIVHIAVEDKNPQMAAKIANTIAKVYIKEDMEEKRERAHNVRIFIEEQLAKAKQRLTETENNLKSFQETGKATGIAVILQNNIATLEKQKIELRKIFTEKYPDVVKINEQIENLKGELQNLPESELEYARLTRDVKVNEKSYLLLQSKLEEARIADEAEKIEDVKVVNPAMTPKVPIKPKKKLAALMGLVVGLVVGVFASFVVETMDTSIGTIDDLESLLNLPVLAVIPYMKTKSAERKKWWGNWLAGARTKREGARDPRALDAMREQLIVRYGQRSSATEAYRILRTNIKVRELVEQKKTVLLITSTIPKEGKSITALNLALALAQDGFRTLLVDCDLRKALVHKIFKIDKEPGLSDILLGKVTPEKAVRNMIDIMMGDTAFIQKPEDAPGLDNFYLLPCGQVVSNPAELLDSSELKVVFSNLKEKYDFVIVDAPPVLPVPDTIILGTKIADKLYLVYRSGFTSKIAILRAKEQLDMTKAVPSGVVLNSTTPESQLVSDYYHHYYHYRYYTEREPEEEKEGKGK